MAEKEKQRKGLIIYYSVTRNTEKIGLRFKKVMEKYGWKCDMLKVNQPEIDIDNLPYRADDYDLICVGGPNYRAIIPDKLMDEHKGVLTPERLFRVNPGWGSVADDWGPKKGVVFVTYAGADHGLIHAYSCLNMLEIRLEDLKIKCIGKFACCGGQREKKAIDNVAHTMGWTEEKASENIQNYIDNPGAPEFASLTEEQRKVFEKARENATKKNLAEGGIGRWHWDRRNRPYERDMLKAEFFMEDIIEDFYGDMPDPEESRRAEAYPHCQYVNIT